LDYVPKHSFVLDTHTYQYTSRHIAKAIDWQWNRVDIPKISSPPASGVIKPNPFWSSQRRTVPVNTIVVELLLFSNRRKRVVNKRCLVRAGKQTHGHAHIRTHTYTCNRIQIGSRTIYYVALYHVTCRWGGFKNGLSYIVLRTLKFCHCGVSWKIFLCVFNTCSIKSRFIVTGVSVRSH